MHPKPGFSKMFSDALNMLKRVIKQKGKSSGKHIFLMCRVQLDNVGWKQKHGIGLRRKEEVFHFW